MLADIYSSDHMGFARLWLRMLVPGLIVTVAALGWVLARAERSGYSGKIARERQKLGLPPEAGSVGSSPPERSKPPDNGPRIVR